PVAFRAGAARSLVVPMALAVVFAMLMSYLLSRTLVPTMVHYLLKRESGGPNRFTVAFERGFARLRDGYGRYLAWALHHRAFVVGAFAVAIAGSLAMIQLVGRDFFPTVDAGLIKLHVRGSPGTRLEESEKRIGKIGQPIRSVIPPSEIETMLDVLGTPYSGINLSLSEGAAVSPADGQILISLQPGHHPTADYVRALRETLRRTYPETTFFFLAP